MTRLLALALSFAIATGTGGDPAWAQGAVRVVGRPLPDAPLADLKGSPRSLLPHPGRILVLVFWSFRCPVSLAYNEEVGRTAAKYRARGVEVIAVASGTAESAAEVRRNATNLKLGFDVVLDGDGMLASRLGVVQIPAVFIADAGGIVRYAGAWDDNRRLGATRGTSYVEPAIEALLAGREVMPAETQTFGCTLQRR